MEMGGWIFLPWRFGAAEKGVETLSLVLALLFASSSSILDFFFRFVFGLFLLSRDGGKGNGG